jgi:hypothetical protein
MIKFTLTAFILLLLLRPVSAGNASYIIELKSEKWNINPRDYYIAAVTDDRIEKKDAGRAYMNGKPVPATFGNSLESDLMKFFSESVEFDTSKVPLIMSFEKFRLNETGSMSKHTVSLLFAITFYRETGGKRYKIFEINGNPDLAIKGAYPNPQEKVISASMRNAFENFNKWIEENRDISSLAKSVEVIALPQEHQLKGDTIIWSSEKKLTWKDFNGKVPNTNYGAQSNCMFTYSMDPEVKDGVIKLKMKAFACFSRYTSWVKDDKQQDDLLAHEQLHFDICELFMRQLRKKLFTTSLNPMEYDKQIRDFFNAEWDSYQDEQKIYDTETRHGLEKDIQEKWKKNIAARLNALEAYSAPPFR